MVPWWSPSGLLVVSWPSPCARAAPADTPLGRPWCAGEEQGHVLADPTPKSPEFLAQQWKPGQSGNPKGKVARPSFESIVERMLDEPGSDELTKREDMARRLIDLVTMGDMNEMRVLLARVWPEVKATTIEVAEGDKSFTFGWKSATTNEEGEG